MPNPPPLKTGFKITPGAAVLAFWAAVIVGILAKSLLRPGHQSVFPVYYDAGERWLHSENLYIGTGYLYSPVAAAFFAPFSMLPMWLADVSWRLLNVTVYAGAVAVWLRDGISQIPKGWHPLVFLILLPLSVGSLNNAQANPLLAALVIGSIISTRREQLTAAAVCIGFATCLKVYPVSVGLLLALLFPRKLAWRLAAAILLLGALPFVFQKSAFVLEQYQNWLLTRAADERRLPMANPPRDFHLLLRVFGVVLDARPYFIVQMLGAAMVAGVCIFGRFKNWAKDRLLAAVFLLGSSWMLLLGPATESATYILLAPAISMAAVEAFARSFPRWMTALVAMSLAVLIGGAAYIAFGGRRGDIYSMSIQQFGTVLFVIFVVAWLFSDPLWRETRAGRAGIRTSP